MFEANSRSELVIFQKLLAIGKTPQTVKLGPESGGWLYPTLKCKVASRNANRGACKVKG